jgi:hypothetical protein
MQLDPCHHLRIIHPDLIRNQQASGSTPLIGSTKSPPLQAFRRFPIFTPTLQIWPNQAISGSICVQNAYTFFPNKTRRLFFQNMQTCLHTAFNID